MFSNIEAAIFDMDGTLIDSMWLWKAIDIEYLGKHNLELPEDLQKEIEGMSFSETAQYFKNRFNIKEDVEAIKQEWNSMAADYYRHKVPLKESVEKLLIELKHNNIKLGIGTSNSNELVSIIMEKNEFENIFESVRTSCEVEKGKPHPDIFLKVAEDLGVKPENCIVFEDIPNGLKAANNAGMRSVAIYDDFSKHMESEKREIADYYLESYEDALGFFERISK
jgi:HAD superfamily hydrolase (TIGR01509 family)